MINLITPLLAAATAGETVTVKYTGTKKVKSVKAVFEAPPPRSPSPQQSLKASFHFAFGSSIFELRSKNGGVSTKLKQSLALYSACAFFDILRQTDIYCNA